ncbi:immunity 26/phosphotriesterase HocA family protein [Chryseobacterium gregarium]|uniref:immunity 26/phosphotriesterase HocA family protein n=1 Tax=Chryseobacterium gregarium TaxID=456299 RepID=UPI00040C7DE2|nr:immunity 26/phosphotriesterase HocA family protein [Chryseobacterium gregarium]
MIFELTNEHRKYLGLIPVESSWDIVKLNEMYLYFDGDTIRKKISVTEDSYFEEELNEKTAENRTVLLPKTSRGKPKKLNFTATQSFAPFGVYFSFSADHLKISNFTTQTTFHSENFEEKGNLETLQKWLSKWMEETTEKDLSEIEAFKSAERKRCKYKEGDFFAFKTDRRNYAFGRILMDVAKRVKTENLKAGKNYGLTHLMGKALIVKVYHKISHTPDVDPAELSKTLALPSQAVMDNQFFYGEKMIIGHQPLEISEYDMLISYSRSISSDDKDTVYLQYGLIYKENDIARFNKYLKTEDKNLYMGYNENPYRNESIGYGLDTEKLEDCIADQSNRPYWESSHFYDIKYDLRNPVNLDIKREIFEFFGLDADKTYEDNVILAKHSQQ